MKKGEKVIINPVNQAENQANIRKCVAMALGEVIENEILQISGEKVELSYDGMYANRRTTDWQIEELNPEQALRNISEDGILLESEFRVDNVIYPAIAEYYKKLNSYVLNKAKQYAFKFDVKILMGPDVLEQAVEILKEKHMLIVSVGAIGHEMALRGIEVLGEDEYKYIFRNSWGSDGVYEIVSDRQFLFNNTTRYAKILNPEILSKKPEDSEIVKVKGVTHIKVYKLGGTKLIKPGEYAKFKKLGYIAKLDIKEIRMLV